MEAERGGFPKVLLPSKTEISIAEFGDSQIPRWVLRGGRPEGVRRVNQGCLGSQHDTRAAWGPPEVPSRGWFWGARHSRARAGLRVHAIVAGPAEDSCGMLSAFHESHGLADLGEHLVGLPVDA